MTEQTVDDGDVMLLCVDGSKHAKEAFNCVGVPGSMAIDYAAIEAHITRIRQENKALEAEYIQMCKDAKIKHHMETITENDAAVERVIMTFIKKHSDRIKAIVMGSRGCGALRRTFMGSVSHYVLHHSHVPVIICPHHH